MLPRPEPRAPYFGMQGLPDGDGPLATRVLCRRGGAGGAQTDPAVRIADVDEKALYVRDPYSSMPGVKPYLPSAGARRRGAGRGRHSRRKMSSC